jgi:hypothetical protein
MLSCQPVHFNLFDAFFAPDSRHQETRKEPCPDTDDPSPPPVMRMVLLVVVIVNRFYWIGYGKRRLLFFLGGSRHISVARCIREP